MMFSRSKLISIFMGLGTLTSPADSRVFTSPGWYLVYSTHNGMYQKTETGPFDAKSSCESYNERLGEEDEWYFPSDYLCIYLGAPMANDK